MESIYSNTLNAKSKITDLTQENNSFPLWNSILAQLNFIENDFEPNGNCKNSANKEKVSKIILGVQAIREIEPGNPELADLLCKIDYEYKKHYGLIEKI